MSENLTKPLFFESAGRQIFGLLQVPQSGLNLREGVIICSPGPHEIKKYHWTQKQISNRLQRAGFTVLRFDYFASGDSEGDSNAYDLLQCQKNIEDAVLYLKATGLIRRVTIIGTRLGGLLALRALQSQRVKRLLLIDPILDGHRYLTTLKDLHTQMLDDHPQAAPFRSSVSNHRQLLGYPHSMRLESQLLHLRPDISSLKVKSLVLLQTQQAEDLRALAQQLMPLCEEIHSLEVQSDLRWDNLEALQWQDFPNELIGSVVDAVRGGL